MKIKREYEIDQEIAERFSMAATLSQKAETDVLQQFMQQYVKKIFSQEVARINAGASADVNAMDVGDGATTSRATSKVPVWARKPKQINHQILKSYLATCDRLGGSAHKTKMLAYFRRNNPSIGSQSFINNLNSMMTDSGNAHGKVFDAVGDMVQLNDAVKDVVAEYAGYFYYRNQEEVGAAMGTSNFEQENAFRDWFENQFIPTGRNAGNLYSSDTIYSYCEELKYSAEELRWGDGTHIEETNLFNYTTPDEFARVRNKVELATNFRQINSVGIFHRRGDTYFENYANDFPGAFSAAMNKYDEFLRNG